MKICLILKEEYPCYLKEWIDYHCHLGSIFIYDNNDKPGTLDIPGNMDVTVYYWPGKVRQLEAYMDFCKKFPTDVLLFIDSDEFWVRNAQVWYYEQLCRKFGALAFNWQVYGDSGIKKHDSRPQTEKFIHRHPYNSPVNHHIKTMVVGGNVWRWVNPHQASLVYGTGYNRNCHGGLSPRVDLSLGYINHYFTRSMGEFQQKISRGRADVNMKRTMSEFHEHNLNAKILGGIQYGKGYRPGDLWEKN